MTRSSPKQFILRSGLTIDQAFERVSETGIGFLVDDRERFQGTVTDASIREAALAGVDFERPVDDLVDNKIKAWTPNSSDADIRKALLGFPAIPVVQKGVLSEVRTAKDFAAVKVKPPVAVIMAGGRGQRLRPLTDKVPKPLLKMGSTSIIERIISAIAESGVRKIYLSVNYKAQAFERRLKDGKPLGVDLQYLREKQKLGTAGALSLVPGTPTSPILVTNADILTRLRFGRLREFHALHKADMTVAGTYHAASIPYGVMRTEGVRLIEVEEKPEIKVLCNAGIYMLDPKVLKVVKKEESLDMPELIDRVKSRGGKVNVFPVIEKWFDIGSPEDFQKVLMEFATYEEE